MSADQIIAKRTGIPLATAERIGQAHMDVLAALANPDSEGRGRAVREKYPDLFRDLVTSKAGGSNKNPVTYELEATITQLESGATPREVVEFMIACHEMVGHKDALGYRAWADEWTKEGNEASPRG